MNTDDCADLLGYRRDTSTRPATWQLVTPTDPEQQHEWAALLAHRLGSSNVFSVDVDPVLIDIARPRLARLGYQPTPAAADGAEGLAAYAPYDRIIATCSVPAIPPAWIEQLRPGGRILADVEGPLGAGNLVTLHRPSATLLVQAGSCPGGAGSCGYARTPGRPWAHPGPAAPPASPKPPAPRSTPPNWTASSGSWLSCSCPAAPCSP